MRPTGAANEAANTNARSRKSSIAADRRPSIGAQQPTSFFLAREEDIFGTSATAGASKAMSRRSSASQEGKSPSQKASPDVASESKSAPLDSMYGVQSLQDALGQAFDQEQEEKAKEGEQDAEPSTGILAGLLKRKRRQPSNTEAEKLTPLDTAAEDSLQASPQRQTRVSRGNTISQPLTPIQLESPFPESTLPGTPKSGSFRSLQLSEADEDAMSQAITSGGEEEDEDAAPLQSGAPERGNSMPELVMPSLAMPSRRPFTERGKQMGRLKVAVAGVNGSGKTSLIRAIVRQCEDIVHLDPINTPTPSLKTPQPGKKNKKPAGATMQITEIQASTKAYPAWWSDMEDSRVLRRRKSLSETVLERNLTFVDSPGFEQGKVDARDHATFRYLEAMLHKNAAVAEMADSDLLALMSGSGGAQVDVVLYVCGEGDSLSEQDVEHITKLSKLTSVIPVITKADLTPLPQLEARKAAIAGRLAQCGVNASLLAKSSMVAAASSEPDQTPMPQDPSASMALTNNAPAQAPFAVSCLPGSDDGEMDASLLMSPEYSPPLVASELQTLVELLFDPETMAKVRHISARKFIAWRREFAQDSMVLGSSATAGANGLGIRDHLALARRTSSPATHSMSSSAAAGSGVLVSRHGAQAQNNPFNLSSSAIGHGLPDFSRARIRDHIAREERLAQVQLAKWASDLQKALRGEREEYRRLVEGERAKWLLERVGEEAALGNLGALGASVSEYGDRPDWALQGMKKERRRREGRKGIELPGWARDRSATMERERRRYDPSDPLGLCGIGDTVGMVAGGVLKLVGGGVLVGAVWVAVCRAWGVDERWYVGLVGGW